jgi:hypothetical protein
MTFEWNKNDAGNVSLTPLISFQTAELHGIGVGLRFELSRGPDESHKHALVVQVAMSVEQAIDLAETLQLRADHVLATLPTAKPS